jgi:hypothetical protein
VQLIFSSISKALKQQFCSEKILLPHDQKFSNKFLPHTPTVATTK